MAGGLAALRGRVMGTLTSSRPPVSRAASTFSV
jgi:hypothetical protein